MLRTYQVYLTDLEGKRWFEPFLAKDEAELLRRLRQRVSDHPLREARVEQDGRSLFTVER